jgi:SHS2 domain-containing protein
MSFRFLDHTGDTAVEISAASEGELLREAARALREVYIDPQRSRDSGVVELVPLAFEAEDIESLLIDVLNELIFLFDSRRLLPRDLEIEILELGPPLFLRARLAAEPFDPACHAFLTEVKAATFHAMRVERTEAGVSTTVVFDL